MEDKSKNEEGAGGGEQIVPKFIKNTIVMKC